MPRDISGNYTLPAGNPVVDGTIIDVLWANPTMADIAVQLNNVLTRDGILGPTAPILFATGSAAAPSIAFSADPALGIYRAGSNILGFSTGGTQRLAIDASGNSTFQAASGGFMFITKTNDATPANNSGMLFLGIASAVAGTRTAQLYLDANGANGGGGDYGYLEHTGAQVFRMVNQGTGVLELGTAGSARVSITAAGNVTVNVPSSGTAFTVNSASGANAATFNGLGATDTASLVYQLAGVSKFYATLVGATDQIITGSIQYDMCFRSVNKNILFSTNDGVSTQVRIGPAGNVTISAPSSGVALIIGTGANGTNGLSVCGATLNRGQSFISNATEFFSANQFIVGTNTAATFELWTNSLPRVTITSAGAVTINASDTLARLSQKLIVGGDSNTYGGMGLYSFSTTAAVAPTFDFVKSNTNSVNVGAALGTGTDLGYLAWRGFTDTTVANIKDGVYLLVTTAGAWTPTSSPADFKIFTAPAGSTVPVQRLTVTSDGRLFGGALHNNAGAVTGTTNQYIASGTYTPTVANNVNVAAVTAGVGQWIRVGNVVTVSVVVTIDPTAAAPTFTSCSITLPIASNFTNGDQAVGTGDDAGNAGQHGGVRSDLTGDFALYSFTATSGANIAHSVTFTYVIL